MNESDGGFPGAPGGFAPGGGSFPDFSQTFQKAPPLHMATAMPLARDRWERLVTTITIQAPADVIWHALTSPESLSMWLASCHGSLEELERDCTLDFEDGEFFFCRPLVVEPPHKLVYMWRWLGIGQATQVTWEIKEQNDRCQVIVTEEAMNPPWDWQTWNGGGWPGILEQLASFIRTGREWRWPWRRMGPYAQIELPVPFYIAWDALFNESGLRFWMQVMKGDFEVGGQLDVLMGDASGMIKMTVTELVKPGEKAPSFLPYVDFTITRGCWDAELSGRIWMEPAGLHGCLLQVFHQNWESLPPAIQLSERKLVASFWSGALRRAMGMLMAAAPPSNPPGDFPGASGKPPGPHSW